MSCVRRLLGLGVRRAGSAAGGQVTTELARCSRRRSIDITGGNRVVTALSENGKSLVSDTIGPVTAPLPPWPTAHTRTWPAVVLAAVAVVLAAAALIVALTRPTNSTAAAPLPSISLAAPTSTAADTAAAAAKQICDAFEVAAHAVMVDSQNDPALGRIALTNGAGLLEAAVTPAAPTSVESAARALAAAYRAAAAVVDGGAADPPWRTAVDAVTSKTDALRRTCNG